VVAARNGFDDGSEDPPVKALTRDEARALRARNPPLSPWRVIAVQARGRGSGGCARMAGFRQTRGYVVGALRAPPRWCCRVPLMARGMTSRLSSVSLGTSAVSVMLWSTVKIGVSIAMLMLAPKLVQPLSWPALLAAMVLCMQVYWFALLWRGR